MIEELVETIIPGGALVGVGVAIGAAFSKQLRPVAKEAIKAGMNVAGQVQQVAAEAYERTQDLVAEARFEQDSQNGRATGTTGTRTAREQAGTRRSRSTAE